jgi:DNA-directed RNA polymerase subunit M/transcription elongation factor TFIIS
MSTTKLDHQTQASVPLLVTAEAKTKHQPAALTEQYPVDLARSIQPPNRNVEKQNPPLSFCPTCQMLLRVVGGYPSTLRCKKCGYKTKLDHAVFNTVHSHQQASEIAVIDKEKASLHTHPIVQATCEKCGKTESETWTIAVGSEGTVSSWVFLKCTNCGFIRREVG